MPTRKSLHDSWYAQFVLGLSDEQYYCQDYNENFVQSKENSKNLTGENLGTVTYNPKTQRLTIDSKVKKD